MAIVWSNSFDGTPGTNVTVANSASWGDPIAGLRNSPPATSVRYSDQAVMGQASLRLGMDDASAHGDVWLHYPAANTYSLSFYLYLPRGAWFRARDANNLIELYLATESTSFLGGQAVPTEIMDQIYDRWVRVETSVADEWMESRLYWSDIHGGDADYALGVARAGGTVGGIFAQGSGAPGTSTTYMDQVRIGEGEWLGPWPTHRTLTASASLPLAGSAQISAELDDGTLTASATLPLAASATLTRQGQLEAAATLPLAGSARIVRHARMDAAATLPLAAPPVDITREGRFGAAATLPLAGRAELRSQFRPTFPPMLTTEILLDDEWVDISGDVYTREPVHITRGRADEAAQADPSGMSLVLNNRHGRYSPHNPMSPYYGSLGRNTPIRVRVGPMPEQPEADLSDTFDRTITGGWGTADTGQTWDGSAGRDATYSVSSGAGHHILHNPEAIGTQLTTTATIADVDATWTTSMDQRPLGIAGGAIYSSLRVRDTSEGYYLLNVSARVDTGGPGELLRVNASVSRWLPETRTVTLTSLGIQVPGLGYRPGEWLRVRAQAVGPILRVRAWADGTPEPDVWHAQAWDDQLTEPGRVGLFSSLTSGTAEDTQMPVTVSYRDLAVRPVHEKPDVVRFTGEVVSWPVRWDLSDSDVWVPLTAAGTLRRLGQGAKPLRSPLRREIPTHYPTAYWPLEDGADATRAASPVEGADPLRVSGMDMAADTSLASSGPLPTLGESARMVSGSIPSVDTGAWEVDLLYRLEAPSDPYDGVQPLLSIQTTTITVDLDMIQEEDRPAIRRTVTDGDGMILHRQFLWVDAGDVAFFGQWRRLRVWVSQTGASSEARLDWLDPQDEAWGSAFTFNARPGRVTGLTTQFGAELEGLSLGHLTVWGTTHATAYIQTFSGFQGETARDRISRLAVGAEVPLEITGPASERLGPEPDGAFLDIIGQAQDADLGAPGEARDHLGLTYRGRTDLYNQDPKVVFDYTSGEISDPFDPEDDDQALRNDVEVVRLDGSSVQVEDADGPLGVERVGRYDESITLNLADDGQVAAHAGWRLHLGTVDELRWPSIRINLASLRLSPRVEDIIGLDAGDRIRILNPPPWTQERALDLIVQGYEETINLFTWEMVLTCTPASPWIVGQVPEDDGQEDAPGRADTAGSELAEAVGVDDTLMLVTTTQGPVWVTTAEHPDDFPLDIVVGGEEMLVTAIIGIGTDLPQSFVVERATNRVHKSHPAGAPVRLARPMITAL